MRRSELEQLRRIASQREPPMTRVALHDIGNAESVRRELQSEFEKSLRGKESTEKLIQRLQRVTDMNRARAATIAQTERTRSANSARVLDALVNGTFRDEDGAIKELVSSLLVGASWHQPDHYFLLHDFDSYMAEKLRCNREYTDRLAFARKCLINMASAGKFSSDRTIRQYADEIWHV